MKELVQKINWQKVAKVAGCVLTGIMACASALGEQKQADKIVELETRLSNLESK